MTEDAALLSCYGDLRKTFGKDAGLVRAWTRLTWTSPPGRP